MRRCLLPLLFALLPVACATPRLSVTPQIGTFDVEGKFGISSTGVSATNELTDMGVEKDSGVFSGRLDFKWGLPHLSVSTQSSTHGGSGTLTSAIDHDGMTIGAGAPVNTDLDLDLHNATLTFDIAPTDMLEVGIGFGVTAFGLDMAVTDIGTGTQITTDETVPIPVLAARVAGQWSRFELAGLLSGFSISSGDTDVSFFDVDLFGRYRFFGGDDHVRGSVILGFRSVTFDLEYEDGSDDAEIELDMAGPYFGLQFTL